MGGSIFPGEEMEVWRERWTLVSSQENLSHPLPGAEQAPLPRTEAWQVEGLEGSAPPMQTLGNRGAGEGGG